MVGLIAQITKLTKKRKNIMTTKTLTKAQRFVVTHGGDSYYNEGGYEEFKELANLDLSTVEKTAKKLAKAYLNMEVGQRWVKVETIIDGAIYTLKANAVHVMPTRKHVDSAELIKND